MTGSHPHPPDPDPHFGFHEITDRTGELLRGFWSFLRPEFEKV